MQNTNIRTIPDRMVVLSLLPPPSPYEGKRPFGYGAFIVSRRSPAEANFSLKVHGFAAGYDPGRIRRDIRSLFTPETRALIYAPTPQLLRSHELARLTFPPAHLDLVPRSGLLSNIFVHLPHDILAHSARLAGVATPSPNPSPLQRISLLGDEAQAAWVYWLFKRCSPKLRRSLLASHAAWRMIEKAKSRLTRIAL